MAGLSGANSSGGSAAVRAGRAFVELSLSGGGAVLKTLDHLRSRFQSFGNNLLKIGGLTGGIGASVTAAFKPAINALDELAQIGDTAKGFNLTAEAATRLFGIMSAGGSDLRDATEGIATFNQRIEEGLTGKGEVAAELFKKLGVSAEEFAALKVDERFYKLFQVIRNLPPEMDKVGVLMKAVGEDTGKNLKTVLALTADEVRNLGDAFQASTEEVEQAREAARAQTIATAMLGRAWREIGVAVVPVVKEFAERVVTISKVVGALVRNNQDAVAMALRVAVAMAGAGAVMIGLGTAAGVVASAIGGVVAGVKILVGLLGAILSPAGLVTAAIAGLGYLFVTQTKTGREFFAALKGEFGRLAGEAGVALRQTVAIATEAWGGIVAAVGKGDLALAGQIAVTALELAWLRLTERMRVEWASLARPFIDTWHQVTDGLGLLFTEVWGVAKQVFGGIAGVVNDAFTTLREEVGALIEFLAPILAPIVAPFLALADLVGQAWDGLSNNIMETLNNFTAWTEKSFVRMAASIDNAFKSVARSVLDSVIGAAEVLNRFDPAGTLTAGIELAKMIRGGIGADTDPAVRVAEIEAERKKLEDELRRTRELDKRLREAGDAAAAKVATDKAAELEAKLRGLVALAKAPGAFDFGGAGGAIAQALAGARAGGLQAASIAGSAGTFSTAMIGQRFGAETIPKQQLKVAQENLLVNKEFVKVAGAIAKGLTFK